MDKLVVHPARALRGRAAVPGDKSISHRALLLGALAAGDCHVEGFLPSADCLATLGCLQALGIEIEVRSATSLTVHGQGLHGLRPPAWPLDCVRSGTTMRLLAGILAGQPFASVLAGDAQLLRRPMRRIAEPLRLMGAEIETIEGHAPLNIRGRPLHGYDHALAVASAQVKSALLLAGLYADGPTIVRQPGPARDHTERMMTAMGAPIQAEGLTVTLSGATELSPLSFSMPGDLSSAAFLLIAAAIVPGSHVTVIDIGVNPTRTGLLDVLRAMGARISVEREHLEGAEPVADVTVQSDDLRSTDIGGDTVVRMIDEFPVLAVAATQASGITRVRDAAELRIKETDRIATVVAELQVLGARIDATPDGFAVEGPVVLRGGTTNSHGDHRLAMALTVAGLVAQDEVVVEGAERIRDSFPGFVTALQGLGADIRVG